MTYTRLHLIGSGGSKKVYLCIDSTTQEQFAWNELILIKESSTEVGILELLSHHINVMSLVDILDDRVFITPFLTPLKQSNLTFSRIWFQDIIT